MKIATVYNFDDYNELMELTVLKLDHLIKEWDD